jgi:hypothetical protein
LGKVWCIVPGFFYVLLSVPGHSINFEKKIMQIGNLTSLRKYFADFALSENKVFIYGSANRLVEKSRSNEKFDYPLLHLNRPFVKPLDNGMANYMNSFFLEICALDKYNNNGTPEQNDDKEFEAEANALELLMKLEKKMNHDNNDGIIVFDLNSVITEPVQDNWIDYHIGWKMTFRIDFFANSKLC